MTTLSVDEFGMRVRLLIYLFSFFVSLPYRNLLHCRTRGFAYI